MFYLETALRLKHVSCRKGLTECGSKKSRQGDEYMILTKGTGSLIAAILITLAGIVAVEAAEKGHAHKAPHGGVVKDIEGMHLEFLLDKAGEPKLYLYDKSMKPLERTDLQAKLTLKGHDGSQHSRELKPSKDPKVGVLLRGDPIKGVTDWNTAVVSLKLKDSWHDVHFAGHSKGKAGH
jgi:hypothetical protein